jgi:hypothetical protein
MKRGIKKELLLLGIFILCVSFSSAEIIFSEQTKSVYNLGDTVKSPVTLSYSLDKSDTLKINLICDGATFEILNWEGFSVETGKPFSLPYSFKLNQKIIGGTKKSCLIQAMFGEDVALSNEFKISDWLSVSGNIDKPAYNSGEVMQVSGKVTKETGEDSTGFIEVYIETEDSDENITQLGTVTGGNFAFNISLPSDIKAGSYMVKLNAYEKDSNDLLTNSGKAEYNITINQVPTILEIVFDKKELDPEESLIARVVLHDQTGDPIDSSAWVILKDNSNKIIEEKELNSSDALIFPIAKGTAPSEWKILASSKGLNASDTFTIKVKESIKVQIVNQTIEVTNNGNVFYNKTLLIKVQEEPLNIQVVLDVGKTKKYVLSAPKGEYEVKVLSDEGDEASETMSLTGRAVGIREQGVNLTALGMVLVGIIAILVIFLLIRRLRKKRSFSGGFKKEKITPSAREPKEARPVPVLTEKAIITPVNKAEISLSIKGEKQESVIVGLKVKNLREFRVRKGSPSDTLKQIIELAQDNKAVTYENNDYLLFILAPANTRTMKNEAVALGLAEEMKKIMMNHNRMFNQRMDYGISLNKGEIVGKRENGVFKFMGIGNLIGMSKKIATLSDGEVLLSETVNNLLRVSIKSNKETRDGFAVYVLESVKKENEETKKFINRFMERQKRG